MSAEDSLDSNMAVKTTPKLHELPEELVSNISVKLHADDIAALRLTCRALEHKSFHEFATEYFTEKAFYITTDSLKTLVSISHSEKLKGYLQVAHFLTGYFSEKAFKCPNGCQCAWQPSVKQEDAFRIYLADQRLIEKNGTDKKMLEEAFANLTGLKLVNIVDSISALPSDVDIRGKNKIRRLTGRLPSLSQDNVDDRKYDQYIRHIWKILMNALADSKMTTLDSLASQLGRTVFALSVMPDVAVMARPEMKPVLANLKHLVLRLRTSNFFKKESEATSKKAKTLGATAMKHAAKAMSSLHTVDLTFDSAPTSGLYFTRFAQNLNLENLNKLYLKSLYIQASSLGIVLCRMHNIKDLRLTFVNLTKGSWPTILKAIQKLTGHLTHLHMMYLMEAGQKAFFLRQINEDEDDRSGPLPDDFMGISDSDENESDNDDLPALEPIDGPDSTGEGAPTTGISGEPSEVLPAPPPSHAPNMLPVYSGDDGLPPPPTLSAEELDQFIQPLPSAQDPLSTSDTPQDDFVAPGDPGTGERGYYVCIKDEQIATLLPKFIEEYNLGEDIEDEFSGAGGFLDTLGAAFGMPPGVPPFPAPPTGNHGNNHAHNTNTTTTTNTATNAAANANGTHTVNLGNDIVLGMGPLPPGAIPMGAVPVAPGTVPPPPAGPNGTLGGGIPPALLNLFANSLGMAGPPPAPPVPDDMD